MTSSPDRRAPAARQTRAEAKAESRRRLIEAALSILDSEGEGTLTTTHVAELAGLRQATFYVHFASVDDLLTALVDEVLSGWAETMADARQRNRESPEDVESFRETFRTPMTILSSQPQLLRIVMRNRLDSTSPIGRWTADLYSVMHADLFGDLLLWGYSTDTDADARKTHMIADGIIALVTEMVLGLTDGRYPDMEEAIDVLSAFSAGYNLLHPETAALIAEMNAAGDEVHGED